MEALKGYERGENVRITSRRATKHSSRPLILLLLSLLSSLPTGSAVDNGDDEDQQAKTTGSDFRGESQIKAAVRRSNDGAFVFGARRRFRPLPAYPFYVLLIAVHRLYVLFSEIQARFSMPRRFHRRLGQSYRHVKSEGSPLMLRNGAHRRRRPPRRSNRTSSKWAKRGRGPGGGS